MVNQKCMYYIYWILSLLQESLIFYNKNLTLFYLLNIGKFETPAW